MADQENGNPFDGYDERLAREQADEAMYSAHELWKETTWQGKIVSMVQAVGEHFRPFFLAVADALQEETSSRAIGHVVRLIIVVVGVLALYVVANLIQTVIGKEIIIEQEIIIIEEVRQSDLDDENEKRDETMTVEANKKRSKPRSSRDKKTQ